MLSHAEEIKLGLTGASELFSSETGSILLYLNEAQDNPDKIKEYLPGGEELACAVCFIIY